MRQNIHYLYTCIPLPTIPTCIALNFFYIQFDTHFSKNIRQVKAGTQSYYKYKGASITNVALQIASLMTCYKFRSIYYLWHKLFHLDLSRFGSATRFVLCLLHRAVDKKKTGPITFQWHVQLTGQHDCVQAKYYPT